MFDPQDAKSNIVKPAKGKIFLSGLAKGLDVTVDISAIKRHLAAMLRLFISFFQGLSGRLLLITTVFVVVVEVIILIPSLAAFQERWLIDRVREAEIASIALEASPKKTVSKQISKQLLNGVGVKYLSIQGGDNPDIILRDTNLQGANLKNEPDFIDLRQSHKDFDHDLSYLWGPWKSLWSETDRQIHVDARPRISHNEMISIVISAEPLRQDLRTYLLSILRMTISVSVAFGVVLFALLSVFIVRPMRRLTGSISRFKADPEDTLPTQFLSGRQDEIGEIELALSQMQEEVRHALRSRSRLAALGQAVSKINHDLRNMLTSAQMASDRMASSPDPIVAKAMPRLERALDRALSLAQNVLNYGKSDELPARIQIIKFKDLADAAAEDAGLALSQNSPESVRFTLKAAKGFFIEADPEHLHRTLVNLMRNAKQAIEAQPNRKTIGRITLTALKTADDAILVLTDNGPGIPEKMREKLFQPFSVSNSSGGSGLGLAIARELAQTQGGDVRLIDTGPMGTSFEIRLPLKP